LSIAGADSVAPVADEANTPRRLIPVATILITPVLPIWRSYIGSWAVLVPISPAAAYGYLGEVFLFFVLVLYIFVNLANLVYHARFRREQFNWFLNGFIPVAGIVIDGYILYKGFFVSEISLPFETGSSIVRFSLAWAVIGIAWALSWSRRRHLASISLSAEA
jgi:amino acid transporter